MTTKDTIFVGNDDFLTRLTLFNRGARTTDGGGGTEIDWRVTAEAERGDGFGTGLDIMVFDGRTQVDPEAVSFGTGQLPLDISGTIAVNQALDAACLKIGSLEGTLWDESPTPDRVCAVQGLLGFLTQTEQGALALISAGGVLAGAAPEAAERIR